jgi:hypothetical protein
MAFMVPGRAGRSTPDGRYRANLEQILTRPSPPNASVVTSAALTRLDRPQLAAVLAHEAPFQPTVLQKDKLIPGGTKTKGSAPVSDGTSGFAPWYGGALVGEAGGSARVWLLVRIGVAPGSATATGATPTAPPIAAMANHGATYLIDVFMVLSRQR